METTTFYWKLYDWPFLDKVTHKWVTYPEIDKHAEFCFVEDKSEIANIYKACVVTIDASISSEDDLMNVYNTQLRFPWFGFNWDALWDNLCYLDWIEQENIIIYHEALPQLNNKDLEIYLKILRDAVGDWNMHKEHDFHVYFNIKDYDKVKQITGSIPQMLLPKDKCGLLSNVAHWLHPKRRKDK